MTVCPPAVFGSTKTQCHMCDAFDLRLVIDLGMHPHSDDFLTPDRLGEVEHTYPLRLMSCGACGLLQIDYFVNPDILYRTNYVYESSITRTGVMHYKRMAEEIAKEFGFAPDSLVVDIGSNVGVLLTGFKEGGFQVLGVDPAEKVAQKAQASGIDTVIDYFSKGVAESIVQDRGQAAIVTGTNVFAHIHDLPPFLQGIQLLLAPNGVFVVEAPYALDMIERVEYDTIYHQHIGYLSVRPMQRLFERFGLELFHVTHQDIHGGTLRYYVGHKGKHVVSPSVLKAAAQEEAFGLYDMARLQQFASDVFAQRRLLLSLLDSLRGQGKRIAGIAAPAKGNTLLNFCNIGTDFLEYLTEKSAHKQGLYTPGTHIPIYGEEHMATEPPDYALILAWNFADEIMKNNQRVKDAGGTFIIPIPKPYTV